MVEISIAYEGQLRCAATHGPSGATLHTDAPVDNHGKGESFSPTDLVATALGGCMATIMGIYAQKHDMDLKDMRVKVKKHMNAEPRRIGKLEVEFTMPAGISERDRKALERAALACPVHHSLHPDIEIPIVWHWS